MILYYYIHLIADAKVGQPILMRTPVRMSLRLLGEQTPSPFAYKTPEKLQGKRQGHCLLPKGILSGTFFIYPLNKYLKFLYIKKLFCILINIDSDKFELCRILSIVN